MLMSMETAEPSVYPNTTDYDFDGLGLTLTAEDGQSFYVQGEDAYVLYDLLESLQTEEEIIRTLGNYDTLWNPIPLSRLEAVRRRQSN